MEWELALEGKKFGENGELTLFSLPPMGAVITEEELKKFLGSGTMTSVLREYSSPLFLFSTLELGIEEPLLLNIEVGVGFIRSPAVFVRSGRGPSCPREGEILFAFSCFIFIAKFLSEESLNRRYAHL